MKLKLSISGDTSIGNVRNENEDSFVVAKYDRTGSICEYGVRALSTIDCDQSSVLIAVADGLGGHAGGAIASQTTIATISTFVRNQIERGRFSDMPPRELLMEAVQECHGAVSRLGFNRPGLEEMATTLTAGWIAQDRLHVMHVGDSRAYLFRKGNLKQLTTDHTLANKIAEGKSDDSEKQIYGRWANVLWNTIGGSKESPETEIIVQELIPRDQVLFCTDGLSNSLAEQDIQRVMSEITEPTGQCQELVSLANQFGGRDNITAIVLHVHERCDGGDQTEAGLHMRVSVPSGIANFDPPDQFSAS